MDSLSAIDKTPLFSVLIANYNNGKYLMDAIDSVRQQTYTNWEIIIVDDGSTDNSKAIYSQLQDDARIHIFFNDKNYGCGYTKRRCIELANGEICGFLDPDDALIEESIKVILDPLLSDSKVSMVCSKMFMADKQLNIIGESTSSRKIPEEVSFLEYGGCAITHFVAFRKNAYLKTPGIRPDVRRAVDHFLYYLMEETGKVVFIPQALYVYRMGTGQNISIGYENSQKAFMWDMIAMHDACLRRGLPIEETIFPHFNIFVQNHDLDMYEKGQKSIRNTTSFKLGHALLIPLKSVRNILHKFAPNSHTNQ